MWGNRTAFTQSAVQLHHLQEMLLMMKILNHRLFYVVAVMNPLF